MSLLIPALLSQPAAGGVGSAVAYDLSKDNVGAPADRYLNMPSGILTTSGDFTLVMFLKLPSLTIGDATTYRVMTAGNLEINFLAWDGAGGGCPIHWIFYNPTLTQIAWEGESSTNLLPNNKYCIALACRKSDSTRQLYINGSSEPVASETYTADDIYLAGGLAWCVRSGTYYPATMGALWMHDGFIDLSANIGNFVTGGTNPVDQVNGCKVYMDMTDLTNKGSGAGSWTAPLGIPYQVNW